jgi:phospholipid/cholesterol/gamma-HCH transport system substrate-binding protein
MTNGLNVLPPNRFPFIPPGADPDPGTPVVGPLPPGVVAGPGPAPNQPFPIQPPPNTGGTDGRKTWIPPSPYPPQDPALPFPKAVPAPPPPEGLSPPPAYPPPEKPWGPPPGPVPQANGADYTTYDQSTGVFQDPAGGTGIFAPGRVSSAENWVDLMRDPRQL